MNEPRADIDLLLAQTGWLRRLAAQLVADPGLADDAVQDTLTAALEAPPRGARSAPVLRAWLGSVLQGQVRSAWRSRQRRAERERRFARAEGDEDAAADLIVGRAESAQLLVEEVHGLPEPHRSTLLLFYFEGLSAAEIAQQLALPQGTVRTRLSRARDALRERLDRRHGGERSEWMRAFALLAGLPAPVPAAASLPIAGLLTLTAMAKLVLLVAALVAGTLFLMRAPEAGRGVLPSALERRSTVADAASPSAAEAGEVERAARIVPTEAAGEPTIAHEAIGPDGLFRPLLFGRVTDTEDRPIAGARVVGTWGPHDVDGGPSTATVSDADGRYALVMPERAPLSSHGFDGADLRDPLATIKLIATCEADGHASGGTLLPYPADEPATLEHSFQLTRDSELTGVRILVLGPDGQPAAGVSVALFDPGTGRVYEDGEGRMVWRSTEHDGRVHSDWRPTVPTIPFAMNMDGLVGRGELFAPEEGGLAELVIRTTTDVDLGGVIVDAGGRPVPEASVCFVRSDEEPDEAEWGLVRMSHSLYYTERPWAGFGESRCRVTADLDGRFRVGHLAPGTYWAQLEDDSVHGPFALGSEVVLALESTHSVFVRAIDHEGRAVRGASLMASNPSSSRSGGLPNRLQYTEIPLTEGRWRLTAQHGDAESVWRDIEVPRDTAEPIDLVLDFSVPTVPVTFRLVGADGAPIAAVVYTERRPSAGASEAMMWRQLEREYAADEGVCRAELRAGEYDVRVAPRDEWHLPTWRRVTVESEGGEHAIELERGGRLRLVWSGTGIDAATRTLRPVLHVRRAGSQGRWIKTELAGGAYEDELTPRIVGAYGPFGPNGGPDQAGPLLPPDTWDVRVECEGFPATERTVVLEAGATARIDVRLE